MKLFTKLILLASLLTCLINIKMNLCSSLSKLKYSSERTNTKTPKKLFEDCTKSDECDSSLVCAHDGGKEIQQCDEKKSCKEFKQYALKCLLRSNSVCKKNEECFNNECVSGRCKISEKHFLGKCTYHYLSEECAENTYCAKNLDDYKCLGGAGHPCERDSECYNNSCGMGPLSVKVCNSILDKALKNTVTWAFKDVSFKKILLGKKK